ncbi:MAG: sensory rhodopsin transducer [Chloroflexia bacterium]|nr:sensory rhodopsin transducer [Chloroflexia bacterium]
MVIGKKIWAIAEGYIPSSSTGSAPEMVSHETACILNTSEVDAKIDVYIYFSDKEPLGPFEVVVPARRAKHLRFNDLSFPGTIPRDTDYASVLISSEPVVVQHTRLDSRQSENALISTIAYAGEE